MNVSTQEHHRRMKRFVNVCREKKFPITPQKNAIFQFLAGTTTHPTADDIFSVIQKQFPTLSLATVYKNLQKLVQLGLVQEIRTHDKKLRYDARIDSHHHMVLPNGQVIDVDINEAHIPLPQGVDRDDLSEISILFYHK